MTAKTLATIAERASRRRPRTTREDAKRAAAERKAAREQLLDFKKIAHKGCLAEARTGGRKWTYRPDLVPGAAQLIRDWLETARWARASKIDCVIKDYVEDHGDSAAPGIVTGTRVTLRW